MREAARFGLTAFIALRILGAPSAVAQISPGPLSEPHRELEGLSHCLDCHGVGERNLDGRCLECHREIQWSRDEKRGFHALTGVGECASCHPEHGGLEMKIVRWDGGSPEAFDHALSGWDLTGKHEEVACRKCHTPELQLSPVMQRLRQKPEHETYLGLETDCASCHADPHESRLGTDCAKCHTTSGFQVIQTDGFDHSLTKYPLLGAHRQVACDKCHDRVDGKWNRPAFQTCASCHKDPHSGAATLAGRTVDCESCHGVGAFRPSTLTVADHRKTQYPLEGKHQRVACADCHRRKGARLGTQQERAAAFDFRKKSGKCADCHGDAHGGQLAKRPDRGACEECHTVQQFVPSGFTVAAHEKTEFPLEGRHQQVGCRDCHGPDRPSLPSLPGKDVLGSAGVAFAFESLACAECHRNPHDGRKRPGSARMSHCVGCHTTVSFHDSRVDPSLHDEFEFALRGAHAAVPCFECHRELTEPPASSTLLLATGGRVLRFEDPLVCRDCHEDEHAGQFAGRLDGGACESCHDSDRFKGASKFDHDTARFALDGAHENVECSKCHPRGVRADGTEGTIYRPIVPHRCQDCHAAQPPLREGERS